MTRPLVLAAATLALAVASGGTPAWAAGCLSGAAVGGVAGHMAGHGVLGAAAGCAIGHHEAAKNAKAKAGADQNDATAPVSGSPPSQ